MNSIEKNDFSRASQISARANGDYVRIAQEAESSGRCVFCHLKEKYVITRQNDWALTANLFPRSTGDLMVVPERHVERYRELNEDDLAAMGELNQLGVRLLKEGLGIDSTYIMLRDGSGTDKTVRHLHGQVMQDRSDIITWSSQETKRGPEALENLTVKLEGWVLKADPWARSFGDLAITPEKHLRSITELVPSDFLAVAKLNKLGMDLLGQRFGLNSFYLQMREGVGADSKADRVVFKVLNFWKGLIKWNVQEDLMEPIKVAEKLRETLKGIEDGKS